MTSIQNKQPRAHSKVAEVVCVLLFISVMACANLLIAHFGPWFLPVTAFFAVGVSLVSRDYLHDVWKDSPIPFWPRMLAMIAAAAVLAYAVDQSAKMIAIASVLALTSSAITETLVFTTIFKSKWMIRSNVSSVFGAIADSIVFPLVAFGYAGVEGFWLLVATQTLSKSLGAGFWSTIFRFTINPDEKRARRAAIREQLAKSDSA